jgi:hypothetical protein
MKRIYIPIIFAAAALTSCSVYKNNQTPDDVYYSPGTPKEAAASNSSNNYSNYSNGSNEYYSTANDQYVQMKAQDPERWSYFDDYNYDYYSPYSSYAFNPYYSSTFGYGMYGLYGMTPWIGFGYYSPFTYWNSYYTWNSIYNPYYGSVVVVNPKVPSSTAYTQLRTFNPSSYSNNFYNRGNNLVKTAGTSTGYQPYSYSQTIRNNYNTSNNLQSRSYFRTPNSNFNSQPVRTFSAPSFGGGGGIRAGGIGRPGR